MQSYKCWQKGISLSVILLAIVLLAAISVAIATSSRSSTNSSESQTRLMAATLIQQANLIRMGFDQMQANGIGISTITFDNATPTGLWNPVSGTIVQQFPPLVALYAPFTWTYKDNLINLQSVGTPTGAESVLFIVGVKLDICQKINQMLYNDSGVPTMTAANATQGDFLNLTQPQDLSDDSSTNGRLEQCVFTSDRSPIYYKVIYER